MLDGRLARSPLMSEMDSKMVMLENAIGQNA